MVRLIMIRHAQSLQNAYMESIMEKIEYAIEQHPSFLKVIPEDVLKAQEKLNVKRQWDF